MTDSLKSRKVLSYKDVSSVSPGSSNEELVNVTKYDQSITTEYIKKDMVAITGNEIYVRDSVAKKLASVEAKLNSYGYRLKIVYGYRHPEVQKKYFDNRKSIISEQYPELAGYDLDEYTHNFVAVPDIAGHPAGAAVDLTLIKSDGSYVDMGTTIADYSDEEKIKTYAEGLTMDQVSNRSLLHNLMIEEDFAPFYGEWWHFSYGDREWAAFYNKKALYGAIDFRI